MINFIKSAINFLKFLVLLVVLIGMIVFMVSNRGAVSINLNPFPFEIETKVFVVMLIFFILGVLFGIVGCSQSIIVRMVEGFNNRRKIKKLEKQVIAKSS